jgi:hypothetical protein
MTAASDSPRAIHPQAGSFAWAFRREHVRTDTGAQWLQQRATSFQIVPAKYLSAAAGGITQQDMRSTWQDYIHQYL